MSSGEPAISAASRGLAIVRQMGETVEFASNGGTASGYLVVPEGGSGPGVVVVQEWWGLDPSIKEVTERLGAAGFVALDARPVPR